jgi:hypothetical protein
MKKQKNYRILIFQENNVLKNASDGNIGDVCIAYINPSVMFRLGPCALKSNKVIETSGKKKINPLKASKRARRRGIR